MKNWPDGKPKSSIFLLSDGSYCLFFFVNIIIVNHTVCVCFFRLLCKCGARRSWRSISRIHEIIRSYNNDYQRRLCQLKIERSFQWFVNQNDVHVYRFIYAVLHIHCLPWSIIFFFINTGMNIRLLIHYYIIGYCLIGIVIDRCSSLVFPSSGNKISSKSVVIIGGGAAGYFSAIECARVLKDNNILHQKVRYAVFTMCGVHLSDSYREIIGMPSWSIKFSSVKGIEVRWR